MKRILIAEDDAHIQLGLVTTLESEGYEVFAVSDGQQAMSIYRESSFDLLVLDVMMPEKSGFDVCRDVRAVDSRIPIMMLTAKGEEIDKVVGLKLGADDYMTKPFGISEFLARVEALLRRSALMDHHEVSELFTFGYAKIDTLQHRAFVGENVFDLTPREVKLLFHFYQHPKQVQSRDVLLEVGWNMDYFGTSRTLDQHILQLRKKIEPNPSRPIFIKTVHGMGYRYEPHDG